ncbi:cysteine protease domain, YopT-type [Luteitalea pratensis]|uniref:Cysteine protease domain, YopT-type n=1 Tax=Luteitalea pratensis TaxID=1855912 RepID=A0A143PTA7_LUTPR|nr:hypothetical protein [Luteitalea pratensis]AMY11393.1 cysteine protease domain, YopT-type [Luteitalea pratensis]
MTVRDRLASLGTALGDFNQGEFGKDFSMIEGVNPAEGYCAGVALDWTRRVLQSGSGRQAKFLHYASAKNALPSGVGTDTRQTRTLRRMATAFSGQGASYVTTTRKTELIALLTPLLTAPLVNYNSSPCVGVPSAAAKLLMERFDLQDNPFDLGYEPAGFVSRNRIQNWLNTITQGVDPQHSKLADGGREWGQYAKELDDKFSGSKKRKFGKIHVVTSSNQQTYGSPGAWRTELLANGFQTDCCTIVGVGAPGDEGHAVAVHLLGADYRFFDPNYGVYKYSLEGLRTALQHLFGAPFFTDDGLDADLPVYRRRTDSTKPKDTKPWTRMSYTIFAANS